MIVGFSGIRHMMTDGQFRHAIESAGPGGRRVRLRGCCRGSDRPMASMVLGHPKEVVVAHRVNQALARKRIGRGHDAALGRCPMPTAAATPSSCSLTISGGRSGGIPTNNPVLVVPLTGFTCQSFNQRPTKGFSPAGTPNPRRRPQRKRGVPDGTRQTDL
jgi:hypothetical protein